MVAVGIVPAAKVNTSWVVDTTSDCASGEAGFVGIVVKSGERIVTTGLFGYPGVDDVKVGNSNSMSVRAGRVITFHWLNI